MKINRNDLIEQASKRICHLKTLIKAGLVCLNGEFFPSVHYPSITMYPPTDEQALFKNYSKPADSLFVLYVHVPFCIKYCNFCHYPVKITSSTQEKDYYLDALKKEMDIYMHQLGVKTINARSILVGGGTPTYLTLVQLKRFFEFFTARVNLQSCAQFSYDVDPSTLLGTEGKKRLKILKSYGVDRLTIGIQSLNDKLLRRMNRAHTAKEAVKSIEQAKKAGFKINIEFIYGYPGQTLYNWIEVMNKAVSLGAEEIQIYRLKIIPYGDHEGIITKEFISKPSGFITNEQTILMKEIAILILRGSGYHENLRRVFTKEVNDYSRYADDQCCKLFDQIGFGLTAFSSLRDRFGLNTQFFKTYYSLIKQGRLPLDRGIIRSSDDQLRWAIILPLKNRAVYKKFYKKQTGVSLNSIFRRKIERLRNFGLLEEDIDILKTTNLGSFFADEVCHQFHHPQYIPFPKSAYSNGPLNPYNDPRP